MRQGERREAHASNHSSYRTRNDVASRLRSVFREGACGPDPRALFDIICFETF